MADTLKDLPYLHIDIDRFLRRRDLRVISVCLATSLLITAGITLLLLPHRKPQREELIPTKFVKRPPMLKRPLQLKRRPLPKTRPISRPKLALKTPRPEAFGTGGIGRGLEVLTGAMPKPKVTFPRQVVLGRLKVGKGVAPGKVGISRYSEGWKDLSLALLDVDAMDNGRYRGLVVVDPEDRRKLEGFLKLAFVYFESLQESPSWDATRRESLGEEKLNARALQNLAKAMSGYTQVRVEVLEPMKLSDERILGVPFVLLTAGWPFEWTDAEARSLGRYLLSGGFAYIEDTSGFASGFKGPYASADIPVPRPPLKDFVRAALRSQGLEEWRDYRFERLRDDHPVLHCFFDFSGLPIGYHELNFSEGSGAWQEADWEGVRLRGRWVLIFSDKDYRDWWAGRNELEGWEFPGSVGGGIERYLRLGVNLLVFALTQEGGMAKRYVER